MALRFSTLQFASKNKKLPLIYTEWMTTLCASPRPSWDGWCHLNRHQATSSPPNEVSHLFLTSLSPFLSPLSLSTFWLCFSELIPTLLAPPPLCPLCQSWDLISVGVFLVEMIEGLILLVFGLCVCCNFSKIDPAVLLCLCCSGFWNSGGIW